MLTWGTFTAKLDGNMESVLPGYPAPLLCLLLITSMVAASGDFVTTQVSGIGRYCGAPAIFLEQQRGSLVLPVPVPANAVAAMEQALMAPATAAAGFEVLRNGRLIIERDGCLFDNLPWGRFAPPQAKREFAARFAGPTKAAYASTYHLLMDAMQREANAKIMRVVIERSDLLLAGSTLVLGACVWLSPVVAPAASAEPELCECAVDEALGLALAATAGQVHVERLVWEAAATRPHYSEQRGKMRMEVVRHREAVEGEDDVSEPNGAFVPLPWEIQSFAELESLTLEERALSALRAGLRLPRPRDATAVTITALLEPLLDEDVRRQVRLRRALEMGDVGTAAALDASTSTRGRLMASLRLALEGERYREASEIAIEISIETSRRMDVTLDEGTYDPFLDQDDWYARSLANERTRLLEQERRKREGG